MWAFYLYYLLFIRRCTCVNSIRTFNIFHIHSMYFNKVCVFNLTRITLFPSSFVSLKHAHTSHLILLFISQYLELHLLSRITRGATCHHDDARLHAFVTLKRDSHSRCIIAIRDIGIKPARNPREWATLHALLLELISISGPRKDCWMFDQVYRVLMTINKLLIYLAHN